MVSSPMTSASEGSPLAMSPPSSPPSDNEIGGVKVSDEMLAEEKEMMRAGQERWEKEQAKQANKAGKESKKDVDAKYTQLEHLLAQSQVYASALQNQFTESDAKGLLANKEIAAAKQPKAVTGGKMRSYQLEGLAWLSNLFGNGLNGILADEMGLGKTIQTIAFLAFLKEKNIHGPFLVVAPLSTLSNWVEEFRKWAPKIPVLLYHGSKDERLELQKTLNNPYRQNFPVICTSYEICMNDRRFLGSPNWKYIIIDEGHRLKNYHCRLLQELEQYRSENRLLITGTPLQNNLAELWSLLHFLMPTIFQDLDSFETWFDFSGLRQKEGHKAILDKERKQNVIAKLHAILHPFLLRRIKADVESDLPPKREYIIYAPLSTSQREIYREIVHGNIREHLENKVVEAIEARSGASTPNSMVARGKKRKAASKVPTPSNKSARSSRASTPASNGRMRKAKKNAKYEELDDWEYFRKLESGSDSEEEVLSDTELEELQRQQSIALAKKEISNKKLQNPVMQLRLACNSPHNFYWPFPESSDPDYSLVTESGKMSILDQLVPNLIKKGHKVLIFSQFTAQLDILSEWAIVLRGLDTCRIDGSTKQDDRRQEIANFNNKKLNFNLFLLSTRAGGQGINLAAADTVILYDSDWNPQQDLQAQDRVHRIGQTKPVIVYRLATKGTIETTLLEKAEGKRRLEKLVIRKGRFKRHNRSLVTEHDDFEELRKALMQDDFEKFELGEHELLSEEDLTILTDRSQEAYKKAESGEGNANAFKVVKSKREEKGGILKEMQGMAA